MRFSEPHADPHQRIVGGLPRSLAQSRRLQPSSTPIHPFGVDVSGFLPAARCIDAESDRLRDETKRRQTVCQHDDTLADRPAVEASNTFEQRVVEPLESGIVSLQRHGGDDRGHERPHAAAFEADAIESGHQSTALSVENIAPEHPPRRHQEVSFALEFVESFKAGKQICRCEQLAGSSRLTVYQRQPLQIAPSPVTLL
jgi:hypothetical protein